MASQQQQHAPGGHYSGHNPIPTVRQFVENLDKDKAARDKRIDEASKQQNQQQSQPHKQQERQIKGTEKVVTDPTTGREVTIADVNEDMMDEVDNPHLVIPNANLDKQTVRLLCRLYIHSLILCSLSRPTPPNLSKTTSTTRMSQHHQTQSLKVRRPTYRSTAKRRTFSSTRHPQSAMSPCLPPSRHAPTTCAQAS